MRIEHVAMYVNDLEGAKRFLRFIWKLTLMLAITIQRRIFVLIS